MATGHQMWIATALILGSTHAFAGAGDEKYPAYEFKPTIIYSNPELIAQLSGATAGSPGSSSVSQSSPAPTGTFDPKYPVAYFVPSVIYPVK